MLMDGTTAMRHSSQAQRSSSGQKNEASVHYSRRRFLSGRFIVAVTVFFMVTATNVGTAKANSAVNSQTFENESTFNAVTEESRQKEAVDRPKTTIQQDARASHGEHVQRRIPSIPALEPDIDHGPIDDETRDKLIENWGGWHFWDGDEEMRPKEDYISDYPNKDIPGDKFPDNAWQVDAVYVNHFINDGDMLVTRAKEAIFTEYGHGKPLPPEELASRMKMFHWEKIDPSVDDIPEAFKRRGSRDIGGWTTKKAFDGLVRRLLHAMMTRDTFTVVLAGHSAAQGQGNHFRQSYMMQFHKIMKPVFERLGVKLITRNMSQGGLGTLQGGMGSADIYGDEIDLYLWDSGMTEAFAPHHVELVMRQALISGKRVPIIWASGAWDQLKFLHTEFDADVGEWGTGYAGLPTTTDEDQSEMLPWAARNLICVDEREDLCRENRYMSTCWIDREDGVKPHVNQLVRPKGQVRWHPGWRPHQLMGRVLAFEVLEALDAALTQWMEGTMTGQPLADDYWHVTEYYENIRNKVLEKDPKAGKCGDIEGTLPLRMCNTPMKGRTQYSPRTNYHESSVTSILKPASDGYVPTNDQKPLYEGPDVHNPNFDIPEGQVDVLAIVSGRRRLAEVEAQDEKKDDEKKGDESFGRKLEEIVRGKGWEITGEAQGLCDGSYDAVCAHSGYEDCFLIGHHDFRGSVVGNEYSGWLVMNLEGVKEGIIVIKIHTWHYESENPRTRRWSSVNNEKTSRRLGQPIESIHESVEEAEEEIDEMWDRAWPHVEESSDGGRRRLKMRSYECPELPDSFGFDFAIDGKITALNKEEFLEKKQNLQRVVETLTLLDDPEFSSEARNVEVAIRLRGVGRSINFGVSHVYWA